MVTNQTEGKALYLLIGAALCFFLMKSCSKPAIEYQVKQSDTTIYKDNTVYVDRPRDRIHETEVERKLTTADSLEITRRMFLTYYVTDSFYLKDSLGKVIAVGLIEDTIGGNRILFRRVSGRIDRPYLTVNNTLEPIVNYRNLFLGTSLSTNGEKTSLYLDGVYQDRKGNGFGLGWGTGKVIKISYFRRIWRFK